MIITALIRYKRYVLQCFHEATLILKIYQVKCGVIRLKNGWCKTKALHNSQQCSAGPRRDTVPTAWWTWKMDECRVSCASTKTDFLARTHYTYYYPSLSLSLSLPHCISRSCWPRGNESRRTQRMSLWPSCEECRRPQCAEIAYRPQKKWDPGTYLSGCLPALSPSPHCVNMHEDLRGINSGGVHIATAFSISTEKGFNGLIMNRITSPTANDKFLPGEGKGELTLAKFIIIIILIQTSIALF